MSSTKNEGTLKRSIYVGYDYREPMSFAVTCASARKQMKENIPLHGLVMERLREQELYYRPTTVDHSTGQLYDDISEAPMSTQFAISRFLTPILAKEGWAMFLDCDMMFRVDPAEIFALADPSKAIMCVKHVHVPGEHEKTKMGGAIQTTYSRKNWSSVMLFNCDHPSNKKLTVDLVNTVPGRDLHRFCWLEDDEIGELPITCNYLVDVSDKLDDDVVKIVHWTLGGPELLQGQDMQFKDEFYKVAHDWAEAGAVV